MKKAGSVIHPAILNVSSYAIRARMAVLGWLTGIHPSAFKGQSIEFSEHRLYVPGDEVRYIDWRATAKFERVLLKTFQQEASVNIYAVVDTSESMNFSSHRITKMEYAFMLASSALFIGAGQGDRVGLMYWKKGGELESVPPTMGRDGFLKCAVHLDSAEPAGKIDVAESIFEICERVSRRSIVFFLSDFLDFTDSAEALVEFARKEVDLRLVHVLDPAEVDFSISGDVILRGLEGEGEFEISASLVKKTYQDALKRFINGLQDRVLNVGGVYYLLRTDTPVEEAFNRLFSPEKRR